MSGVEGEDGRVVGDDVVGDDAVVLAVNEGVVVVLNLAGFSW